MEIFRCIPLKLLGDGNDAWQELHGPGSCPPCAGGHGRVPSAPPPLDPSASAVTNASRIDKCETRL
jgi:hypothetical protein